MNVSDFPIDPEAILKGVRRWVECESPSWDGAAVSAMAAMAADHLRRMGAQVRTIPGEKGYGDCVFGEFDPLNKAPGILILGHLDTVHPKGSLDSSIPWRESDGRCFGPGLYDMKSGIYLALEALTQLRKAGVSSKLPIRVLLTSDEESGSPSTRKLIEHTASAEKYVLVPEGSEPNGNLVSGRFPTTRFQIWTHGKPSHALLQRKEGSSALAAMAEVITKIESLNGENCSYTVTFVHAGHMVATVPMESYAEVICTAKTQAHLDEALSRLQSLVSGNSVTLTVKIKTCRPTWLPSEADRLLWERASAFAKDAGIQPDCEMLFGGSDGNFTGAMGIPTLDALGPVGANAHQLTENIDIGSLIPRGRILAGLMATLD